ncbi:MAG: lipoate--protein ligase family protein [Planctomycetota bacterium]
MKLLDWTAVGPAENLAIDEALLEHAETQNDHPEVLRLWHPSNTAVILGRSSPVEAEVNQPFCHENGIPILRRCSGGQTVMTGPGCLMYAVILDYRKRPELRMLEQAHQFVMSRMQQAIGRIGIETEMQGTSDLTRSGLKFSGNALRCKRNWLVYHGTMLCRFDVELIEQALGKPIREPDYRDGRSHRNFLTQLDVEPEKLANAIKETWRAIEPLDPWPKALAKKLTIEKYQTDAWNFKVTRKNGRRSIR